MASMYSDFIERPEIYTKSMCHHPCAPDVARTHPITM